MWLLSLMMASVWPSDIAKTLDQVKRVTTVVGDFVPRVGLVVRLIELGVHHYK